MSNSAIDNLIKNSNTNTNDNDDNDNSTTGSTFGTRYGRSINDIKKVLVYYDRYYHCYYHQDKRTRKHNKRPSGKYP